MNNLTFELSELNQLDQWLNAYYDALISPIDSFLEAHINNANLYLILLDDIAIGLTAVHKGSTLSLFYLDDNFKTLGQDIFGHAKQLEETNQALAPTSDEYFLGLALDQARSHDIQAYFFSALPNDDVADSEFVIEQAGPDDLLIITEYSGKFFDDLRNRINQGQIYIGKEDDVLVSYGIIEPSQINPSFASIGMFVLESKRRQGFGSETIRSLKQVCLSQGIQPISGCWYYNHNSRKTLEKAGMYMRSRLLSFKL